MKPREVKAWAIVNKRGNPVLSGGMLPVYWRESSAKYDMERDNWLFKDCSVVRVSIVPVSGKKARP